MPIVRHSSLKRKALARAVALALPAIVPQLGHAQDAPSQARDVEEVVVTGSRIVRRDYDANSPLQTVDEAAFESQSSIALETALNDLPQFVPAAQGMTQLQDQSQLTDNFTTLTAGASTISLRGLGANRNLVLIDGYRAVPVNATMAVDLNSIPAAAIQRVEVITGGASSVYGADAVGGVVNFILNTRFEGVKVEANYNFYQHENDNPVADVVRASNYALPESTVNTGYSKDFAFVMGANFADDQGNATFYATYTDSDAIRSEAADSE
jgi:iron complex outermembrane receptor protein